MADNKGISVAEQVNTALSELNDGVRTPGIVVVEKAPVHFTVRVVSNIRLPADAVSKEPSPTASHDKGSGI